MPTTAYQEGHRAEWHYAADAESPYLPGTAEGWQWILGALAARLERRSGQYSPYQCVATC